MQIIIINKIRQQLDKYKEETGVTKTFLAKQLGMSKQQMYSICKAENITLETLIKFSFILKCDITDLFDYEIKE